jgi:hypothetical protein
MVIMGRNNIPSLITVAAWASITVIAYATLTHVGFVYSIYFKLMPFLMQPAMINYAHFEHIICFALVGVLFGIAYPRRAILVCCIILGGAALLEILQTLTPDRHGTLVDALEKMAGGAAGIFFAKCALQLAGRHRVSWNRSHDFRKPSKRTSEGHAFVRGTTTLKSMRRSSGWHASAATIDSSSVDASRLRRP